jgi:carbon storage regulator
MLVLSRHRDAAIMIGDDIQIVVVEIRGDKVRLGIVAPENVPVHRQEVYDQIKSNGGVSRRDALKGGESCLES